MTNKVLVVDNHPVMLNFVVNLLKKNRFQVKAADSGLSALNVLKTYIPDVVFIDLVMPEIGGEKLCRIIRSMPKIKYAYLVILSAIASLEQIDPVKFGADACIPKGPFDQMAKDILEILKDAGRGRVGKIHQTHTGVNDVCYGPLNMELLSSSRHYEAILNNMIEGIVELTVKKKIIYANPAAINIIGIPEEILLTSNFIDLFMDNGRNRVKEMLQEINKQAWVINKDSPVILNGKQVVLTIIKVNDNNKSILVIINDVTMEMEMEAGIRKALQMETVSTLAGGIAHEFNNALFSLCGNFELLQLELDDNRNLGEYFESIKNITKRMSNLTNKLLAFARGGKYRPQNLSLSEFVTDILPFIKNSVEPGIDLETDLEDNLYNVISDPAQLQMIMSVLVANAMESMDNNICIKTNYIRIKTENADVDKKTAQRFPGHRPGLYACLIVEDNGKGMENDVKDKIFHPFFTTKLHGRGLGMAAVYGVVKNHKGWISVDSALNEGTVVRIYLPAVGAWG